MVILHVNLKMSTNVVSEGSAVIKPLVLIGCFLAKTRLLKYPRAEQLPCEAILSRWVAFLAAVRGKDPSLHVLGTHVMMWLVQTAEWVGHRFLAWLLYTTQLGFLITKLPYFIHKYSYFHLFRRTGMGLQHTSISASDKLPGCLI